MGRHLWHYEMLRNQVIKAAILEQGTGISHQLDYKSSIYTTGDKYQNLQCGQYIRLLAKSRASVSQETGCCMRTKME